MITTLAYTVQAWNPFFLHPLQFHMSMENHRVTIPNAHLPKIARYLRHKGPHISAVHHFSVSSLWTDRAHISAVPSVSAFWLDSSSEILACGLSIGHISSGGLPYHSNQHSFESETPNQWWLGLKLGLSWGHKFRFQSRLWCWWWCQRFGNNSWSWVSNKAKEFCT